MRPVLTLLLGLTTVSATACGPRYRVEPVGSGVAQLQATPVEADVPMEAPAVSSPASTGGDVAITEGGLHRIAVQLRLPHALRVHYELHCPGSITSIDDGESMEAYRTRRIAELERERERQKRAAGALTGAVLGSVGAAANVETPNANARVEGEVDGAVVGEAVAESAIPQVQLDPRDVGARIITHRHDVVADGPGRCALIVSGATPEDDASGVQGSFSVERLIDIKAEQRAARAEANRRAVTLRADLSATLVARGADPDKRDRERAALIAKQERERAERARVEAIARAERDRVLEIARAERERERQIRVRAELAARAELEARAEARIETAMATRSYIISWLGECGGDRYLRQRERAEAERRQQARVRLTMQVRGSLRANLMNLGADPEFRRKQFEAEAAAYEARVSAQAEARRRAELALAARTEVVLDTRASLKGELQLQGAVDRPPRPAPLVEARPPMPSTTAVWIDGWFDWSGAEWRWNAGYWTAPPQRNVVWVAPVEVLIKGTTVVRPGAWVDDKGKRVRDHRAKGTVRDHRKR